MENEMDELAVAILLNDFLGHIKDSETTVLQNAIDFVFNYELAVSGRLYNTIHDVESLNILDCYDNETRSKLFDYVNKKYNAAIDNITIKRVIFKKEEGIHIKLNIPYLGKNNKIKINILRAVVLDDETTQRRFNIKLNQDSKLLDTALVKFLAFTAIITIKSELSKES